jgi:hypothetical protein
LGVATVAGLVLGERTHLLLTELYTSWVALVASFSPVVVAMSALFVSYALLIGAFGTILTGLKTDRSTSGLGANPSG